MGQSAAGAGAAAAAAAHGFPILSSTLTMASPFPPLSVVFHLPHHHPALQLLAPVRRISRLSSFFCGSGSSGSSSSSSTKATSSCCGCGCTCPRSFNSSSSSGLSNSWVSEIALKPFGLKRKMEQERLHFRKVGAGGSSADKGQPTKTRKVVEHVALFKMKDTLTDEQEKEMLDSLWSLQYQIKNILCSTVGRLVQRTPEGYTHALYSRFPSKQALDEYMDSPIRWRVAQDLVIPHFNANSPNRTLFIDFEADVDDDIEMIFRRGDDFQEGLEHFLFFRFKDEVSSDAVDKFLKAAKSLPEKYGDLVQLTVGPNLDSQSKEAYSHGLLARLPSEKAHEAYEEYLRSDPSWVEAMELFDTFWTLTANFVVTPVGKSVM